MSYMDACMEGYHPNDTGDPEVTETEVVSEAELTVLEDEHPDLHGAATEEELARVVQRHIVNDFEHALNLILKYQRTLNILFSADPNFEEARKLLIKYKIEPVEPVLRVYSHGRDITTHTDSIPGEVEEAEERLLDAPPPSEATEKATKGEPRVWEGLAQETPRGTRITAQALNAQIAGEISLPPGRYYVDDPSYDANFTYALTVTKDQPVQGVERVEPPDETLPAEQRPGPAPPSQQPALRRSNEVLPAEPGEEETTDLLNERNAQRLAAEGYVECDFCEGTGKAVKGVLKGRKCSKCDGYGMRLPPVVAKIEVAPEGNDCPTCSGSFGVGNHDDGCPTARWVSEEKVEPPEWNK